MNKRVSVVVAVFVLASADGAGLADPWPEKTLGHFLEVYYQDLFKSCSIPGSFPHEASRIPNQVTSFGWVNAKDIVMPAFDGGVSPEVLFGFVFSEKNPYQAQDSKLVTDRARQIKKLSLVPVPDDHYSQVGVNRLLRADTCDTAIGSAVTASAGWADMAKMKTAFHAQETKQRELLVLLGNFNSPLRDALQSSNQAEGLATRMALWFHYQNNPELLESRTPLYFLDSFRGAVVYGGTRDRTAVDLTASGEGGLSAFFGSFKASSSASYLRGATTKIDEYGVFIRKDPADWIPQGH